MPEVSVVVPAYNAGRFLRESLGSVLAQTFQDLEVVVVDDGSKDDTPAVVLSFGDAVRYVRQENQGVSAARNRGIELSQGRFVAFLDADDIWSPEKLERQMACLAEGGACYSAFRRIGPDGGDRGRSSAPRRGTLLEHLLLVGNVVGTPSTVVVERSLLTQSGGFDRQLSQCADWDLWIRVALVAEFQYVDEPLVRYREHGGNMSTDVALLERDSVRTLEKAFALPNLPAHLQPRRRTALAHNWTVLAGSYAHAGAYGAALRCAARAVALDPGQTGYILGYWGRRAAKTRSASS